MFRYLLLLLLLAGLNAQAQKPADPVQAVAWRGKEQTRYRWKPVPAATRYKIMLQARHQNTGEEAGQLLLAETADTNIVVKNAVYQKLTDDFRREYLKKNHSKCGTDTACTMTYAAQLVAINKHGESKPVVFRTWWQ